ncbi:MAG: hypothetical protein WA766_14065 [Candidatus Acidiferrales bacterium]
MDDNTIHVRDLVLNSFRKKPFFSIGIVTTKGGFNFFPLTIPIFNNDIFVAGDLNPEAWERKASFTF